MILSWWSILFSCFYSSLHVLDEKNITCKWKFWEKVLSHLLLSRLTNIFACKPLSSQEATLPSQAEVVLVRSCLTKTHSHWVTLHFFFCKCGFRLDARLLPSPQTEKSQSEWKAEVCAVAARSDTVRPPSSRPGCWEVWQAAGWLSTQTLQRSRQHAELSRGVLLLELEMSHRRQQSELQHHLWAETNNRR